MKSLNKKPACPKGICDRTGRLTKTDRLILAALYSIVLILLVITLLTGCLPAVQVGSASCPPPMEGATKQTVRQSLDTPHHIYKDAFFEKWVYNDTVILFLNGKVLSGGQVE